MEQYWDNVRWQGVLPRPDSIRPFAVHDGREAILRAQRVQKLSPLMNVDLVGSQEVFGQHTDGTASHPPPARH
jgi:hypothetical protein